MKPSTPHFTLLSLLIALGAAFALSVRSELHGAPSLPVATPEEEDEPPPPPLSDEAARMRLERFAASLAAASPAAGTADMAARQSAMQKLSKLAELIDSGDQYILWGAFDRDRGYAIESYSLTALEPLLCIKVYLSMFMFTDEHTIHPHGDMTVLELPATFREGLDAGVYPLPLWSTPEEWSRYINTKAVALVFRGEVLTAAFHVADGDARIAPPREWDGQWYWSDEKGRPQPRAAQFDFLLSRENPEASGLRLAYAELQKQFRVHGCLTCHSPDAAGATGHRFFFTDPNHTLAARNLLPELLTNPAQRANHPHHSQAEEIPTPQARAALASPAEAFALAANHALAYEAARRAVR